MTEGNQRAPARSRPMRRKTQRRGAAAVAGLWALFIYASVFSDWLEPAGGTMFAEAQASSYLGDADRS